MTYGKEAQKLVDILCAGNMDDFEGIDELLKTINGSKQYVPISEITKHIFNERNNSDMILSLSSNVLALQKYFADKGDGSDRLLIINQILDGIESAKNQTDCLERRIEDSSNYHTLNIEKSRNELISYFVGILGIFTSISFVLFGGLAGLSSISNFLYQIRRYYMFFCIYPFLV